MKLPLPAVSFASPDYLWLLLLLPLAVLLYFLVLHRRRKMAVAYGNFGMLKQALGRNNRFRRHVPPLLFLGALSLMLLGIARPTAVLTVTSHKSTVILSMDVSGSMRATDVKPSRVEAMQAAAKSYIAQQHREVLMGIVAFAASAFLVQSPTSDHTALNTAIDRLELQRGTAVGSGILMSLATLFPEEDFAVNPFSARGDPVDPAFSAPGGAPLGGTVKKKQPVAVEPGSNKSAVIILLTDGSTNAGPDPIEAARTAANHGVRVFTVGFGTANGDIVGFGGRRMRADLDEDSLKRIADITHAQYHRASSAEELQGVYNLLSKTVIVETKETEITAFFTALAALLAGTSALLSLLWFNRIV